MKVEIVMKEGNRSAQNLKGKEDVRMDVLCT